MTDRPSLNKAPKTAKPVHHRAPHAHGNPFVEHRAHRREIAQSRAIARVVVPLTSAYRNPREARRLPSWVRATIGILVLGLSAGLHVAFVITAFGIGRLGSHPAKQREQLAIEVREHEAKPKDTPPPPKEPEPEVKPERVVHVRQVPAAKAEAPQPKETPKGPPARVVGLAFESTVGEGSGDGPAFAVGNSHMGETAKTAAPAKEVPKVAPAKIAAVARPAPNAVATRVPTAGVTFTQPKRKKSVKPDYPPTLKTQGIEGEVKMMVNIGPDGKVTAVTILKGTPYPEFDGNAKKAALQEEYEPATRNGEAIPYTISFTSFFRLTGDE